MTIVSFARLVSVSWRSDLMEQSRDSVLGTSALQMVDDSLIWHGFYGKFVKAGAFLQTTMNSLSSRRRSDIHKSLSKSQMLYRRYQFQVSVDLQAAVSGRLSPVSCTTGAYFQHQSQLWVGAMLTRAGANVGVLVQPGGSKNPDFIIENGTHRYAIEVKRPSGELDAQNIVRKAASQVRSPQYHGGVIVVDLTDCIKVFHRIHIGPAEPDLKQFKTSAWRLLQKLHQEVFDDDPGNLRMRREHLFSLVVFARAAYWDSKSLDYPHLLRHVGTVEYWRRDHRTLRAHRAKWLGELIHRGIEEAGHQKGDRFNLDLSTGSW
jgi:hypothetical protein